MTNTNDTGGPAMPHNRSLALCEHCAQEQAHPGMTLLDYFAGKAQVGLAAEMGPAWVKIKGNAEIIADAAFTVAAAMVAEKRRREGD